MSAQVAPMPAIQGEAMELFSRVPLLPINSSRGGGSRGSHQDVLVGSAAANAAATRFSGRRPSTSAGGDGRSGRGGPIIAHQSQGEEQERPQEDAKAIIADTSQALSPASRGEARGGGQDGSAGGGGGGTPAETAKDTNETKSKLLGGYLRERLLANITSKEPAKELVKRSFRHLHRGQGHVLTLDEFKEGLSNTFGALIPLQLIHATFDIFDTEPRTWQLDFDEFCHWLETGERALNSHGIMKLAVPSDAPGAEQQPAKARKPRANDTSGEFKSSVNDPKGGGMSLEQADRAQLKAHLMKHRHKLHRGSGLTDAQKSIVDHILMDKIKARRKLNGSASAASSFDALEHFKAMSRGEESMAWPAFKKEVTGMLPHLHEESEIKEVFSRMDHNGDGVVDLTDFLMWEERMQEGRGNTDFWALQEEDHLEQIKLARSKASNLLVPDDYDGSTYHAKLSRELAERKRAKELHDGGRRSSAQQGNGDGRPTEDSCNRNDLAQALRDNILSQVKGGTLEMLRAFRHFRPAAAGRRLFMDYREFRESIKQKGLGLSEEDTKRLFGYFDVDGSGEIDFSEFRRFLEGGMHQTGLALGVNRHQEKTNAARSRVAALENSTALDPSLAGDARSDELLKAQVLKHISGGQSEVLRALRGFGTDGGKSESEMDYGCFASAIKRSDFGLSDPEIKQVFNKFRLSGLNGEENEGLPTGELSAQAFRDWLLESHTSTGLDVGMLDKMKKTNGGEAAMSEEQAAEHFSLSRIHTALRAKVVESFKTDHRNLLRAFRGVTRKKGSGITARDFREALVSFGLCDDKPAADRLFRLYDWRREGSISFQELMEIITSNESPPIRLTTSQRKRRLDDERRLPEEAIRRAESALRRGLWSKHLDNAGACFGALTSGQGVSATVGLEGLRKAVKIGGIRGEGCVEQALKQVLQRHAGVGSGSGGETKEWSFQDFVSFYRPADCRKAIALAKERDGGSQTEEELQRAAMVSKGNKARTRLIKQVRRLSLALKAADSGNSSGMGNSKGMPPSRSGRVSRKTFAKALGREGGLGKVGEGELTRLLIRHGCSEQGGSYVNYPLFVASFTAAVRGADSASAIAAVAAADVAAGGAPFATAGAQGNPGTLSAARPPAAVSTKRKKLGGVDVGRSKSNPQLALLPPRPQTAAAATASAPGDMKLPLPGGIATPLRAVNGNSKAGASPPVSASPLPPPSCKRAQTADSSLRQKRKSADAQVARSPSQQGYFKRFTASGGDIDSNSLMKGSKSASALPDLVGQRPEVPKTTPIHRVMKKDVARSAKDLRKAFKQCENPYRRGVVSVAQFQAVCQKNGVTVDKEDVDFLLRLHRHKPSAGGKYAIPPKWAQIPPPGAANSSSTLRDTSKVGVRYDEFLRTCLSATETPMVQAN